MTGKYDGNKLTDRGFERDNLTNFSGNRLD